MFSLQHEYGAVLKQKTREIKRRSETKCVRVRKNNKYGTTSQARGAHRLVQNEEQNKTTNHSSGSEAKSKRDPG